MELDIMTDHFPISEEEIMRAIETGQSEKYILRSVGKGGNFRGYVIYDSKYEVRIADYLYNHSQKKYELKMRPNYKEELAAAARQARIKGIEQQKVKKYKLVRDKVVKTVVLGGMAAILFFAGSKAEQALENRRLNDLTPVAPVVVSKSTFSPVIVDLVGRFFSASVSITVFAFLFSFCCFAT